MEVITQSERPEALKFYVIKNTLKLQFNVLALGIKLKKVLFLNDVIMFSFVVSP